MQALLGSGASSQGPARRWWHGEREGWGRRERIPRGLCPVSWLCLCIHIQSFLREQLKWNFIKRLYLFTRR